MNEIINSIKQGTFRIVFDLYKIISLSVRKDNNVIKNDVLVLLIFAHLT